MALGLMAERNDVSLAEWPAHSLDFMGTKWIDLWVVYMIFTTGVVRLQTHFFFRKVAFAERNWQMERIRIHYKNWQEILASIRETR